MEKTISRIRNLRAKRKLSLPASPGPQLTERGKLDGNDDIYHDDQIDNYHHHLTSITILIITVIIIIMIIDIIMMMMMIAMKLIMIWHQGWLASASSI